MIWRFPGDSTDISLPKVLSTQLPSISICALARSGRGCFAHRHCHRCILLQSSSLAPDRSPIALFAKHICTLPTGEPALNSAKGDRGLLARDPDIGRCWASRRAVRGPEKRPRRGRGQIPPFNSDLGRSAFLPSAETIQAAGSRSLASPAKLEIGPAIGTAGLIAAGGSA